MRERTDCRCCRGTSLIEVFDLGCQPYANAFLDSPTQHEQTSPLVLMECGACGHVQLKHVANGSELFSKYSFMTSSSQRMTEHFAELMAENVRKFVPHGGLVVEIGSNDGTALASIERADVKRMGVDPAENLANIASSKGVPTIARFFGAEVADSARKRLGWADLIVACNVLGHVDDLDDFCKGIDELLAKDGALIVEVPDVYRMVDETGFDAIYHEHLSYCSVRSLSVLFHRHDFFIDRVEPQDVHGGSIRLTIRRGDLANTRDVHEAIDWSAFNQRCQTIRRNLQDWLEARRARRQTVWGYCAAAKATVTLNYCQIGCDLLPVVVDSTPTKQHKFMPGTHQPILPPAELLHQMPHAAVVLAVNHLAEVSRREAAYTESGGRIINPRHLPGVDQ